MSSDAAAIGCSGSMRGSQPNLDFGPTWLIVLRCGF
jgi:hypothetical protein